MTSDSVKQTQDTIRKDQHGRLNKSMQTRVDQDEMSRATADAGLNTFGCIFLEVWVLSNTGTRLIRPLGGAWMDSAFRGSLPSDELMLDADYLLSEAPDAALGVGLEGTIFAESSDKKVQWRQIKTMMNDPFVQRDPSERMRKIFSLGIGMVASTSFSFGSESGIILFFARSSTNIERLRSSSNERCMLEYTDFIGTTFAICKTRKECADMRRQMLLGAIRKVRSDMLKTKNTRASRSIEILGSAILDRTKMTQLREAMEANPEQHLKEDGLFRGIVHGVRETLCRFFITAGRRVRNSPQKWSGVHLHGPPRHSFSDSITVFVWVFLTMLMIIKISSALSRDPVFAFDGGWYSSTLCILFALTPAPVGQPRQIVAAHLWNMLVGLTFQQIPTGGFGDFMEWSNATSDARNGIPLMWKQAMAVGLGVSGQAYMGILHPPATGLSLAFATYEKWSWVSYALLVGKMLRIELTHKYYFVAGNNGSSLCGRRSFNCAIGIDDQSFREGSVSIMVARIQLGECRSDDEASQ
eukprot:CCRYP_012860-RA/>CCRYP_012860-RA protein AED:0.13 eAED:0.13 QI:202/1/1/1/0/0/2/151/525